MMEWTEMNSDFLRAFHFVALMETGQAFTVLYSLSANRQSHVTPNPFYCGNNFFSVFLAKLESNVNVELDEIM
jgi:hypothetical protein